MTYQVDFNELPVVCNARVMQGDTYMQAYELWLNGAPLDLTGAEIVVAVRRAPGKGGIVAQYNVTADDAQQGQFTVRIEAADTERMLGEYYYETEVRWPAGSVAFPDGCVKTVVAGALVVYEDVLH